VTVSAKVAMAMKKSSWIRRMFEEGEELKREVGDENVFDFSLGNPMMEPPLEFKQRLSDVAHERKPQQHKYASSSGVYEARASIAEFRTKETGLPFKPDHIVMTCGAAGGYNVALKAILDPGDEVIVFVPYFPEYLSYIDNHGGTKVAVETDDEFGIDFEKLEAAISVRTKAVIINSPNNPTGRVYDEPMIRALGELLAAKQKQYGRQIFLLADEPYRAIVYNGTELPKVFDHYKNSIVITSHSKDLGLPGERIGYIAMRPGIEGLDQLRQAMLFASYALGFVGAPSIMQRVVASLQGVSVDVSAYRRKRDILCSGLEKMGYQFHKPEGAFYLFPKTPIPDDVAFVRELVKEYVLTVPGSGFGRPGHIRISYCVEDKTIQRALPAFERVAGKYGLLT